MDFTIKLRVYSICALLQFCITHNYFLLTNSYNFILPRKNCCGFFASDGVLFQSVHYSFKNMQCNIDIIYAYLNQEHAFMKYSTAVL